MTFITVHQFSGVEGNKTVEVDVRSDLISHVTATEDGTRIQLTTGERINVSEAIGEVRRLMSSKRTLTEEAHGP